MRRKTELYNTIVTDFIDQTVTKLEDEYALRIREDQPTEADWVLDQLWENLADINETFGPIETLLDRLAEHVLEQLQKNYKLSE